MFSALALSACGPKPLEIATPPIERFQAEPEPEVPAGDTDGEVADYLRRLLQWGRANADKLAWLRDWREGVSD